MFCGLRTDTKLSVAYETVLCVHSQKLLLHLSGRPPPKHYAFQHSLHFQDISEFYFYSESRHCILAIFARKTYNIEVWPYSIKIIIDS